MLKEVLPILVISFMLVLYYDTVDIFLNQLNAKQENELLIVEREIVEAKQQVDFITPYETCYFPVWPIVLVFSCAFGSVLCHFILPLSSFSSKKERRIDKPGSGLMKLKKIKKKHKEETDEYSSFDDVNKNDDLRHLSNNILDIRIKDEVIYRNDVGLINQNPFQENEGACDSLAKLNKSAQEMSFMNICMPNLFHDDMFPAPSSLNIVSNESLTPSKNSLEPLDCSNSKNLYSMLLENKSISKMELSSASRGIYTEENSKKKHYSKTFYEKNCEILTVNNTILDENKSQKSDDTDSISVHQDPIMGLLSMLNTDTSKKNLKETSDKSICVQLLTYNDNDLKSIEKRLETVENGLRKSEEKIKDWGKRINVAETELVDLHEQMYTIYSKFEEEKNTSYIIVSKVSKDEVLPNERGVLEDNPEEVDDGFEQGDVKEDDDVFLIRTECKAPSNSESVLVRKDSSDEESSDDQSANDNKSDYYSNEKAVNDSLNDESFINNNSEVTITELKRRSVALEAILDRSNICHYLPKKKIPQLNVPPHIIPPYKRSSFAGTDSKAELRKKKLKMKIPSSPHDFFWKNRIY